MVSLKNYMYKYGNINKQCKQAFANEKSFFKKNRSWSEFDDNRDGAFDIFIFIPDGGNNYMKKNRHSLNSKLVEWSSRKIDFVETQTTASFEEHQVKRNET